MSKRVASRIIAVAVAVLVLTVPADRAEARIEAVKGKRYTLAKVHGPWMIMVASFTDVPRTIRNEDGTYTLNEQYQPGETAEEAADALVFELRQIGIPAYVWSQAEVIEEIQTFDRLGRPEQRKYKARENQICVLAGNYDDVESSVAQKTLNYIKKLNPESLRNGRYVSTPGRSGPLGGAFLTRNPLLTPEEAARRQRDPLLLRLNSGTEFSLAENKGRYTLVVATFYGKSVTQIGEQNIEQAARRFQIGSSLDDAAMDAWVLCRELRTRNFEAWVWHDRYQSVVTVGSFESPEDPSLRALAQKFGAKRTLHPETHQEILTGEILQGPNPKDRNSLRIWVFDPEPQPMEVPRLR